MAEKRRFKIPTASQIEEDNKNVGENFKSTDIFKNYREQQKLGVSDEVKTKKQKLNETETTITREITNSSVSNKSTQQSDLVFQKSRSTGSKQTSEKPSNDSDEKSSTSTENYIASKLVTDGNTANPELTVKSIAEEKTAAGQKDAPKLAIPGKTNSLLVNPRQRGNPILKFVRNITWEFGDIMPDYVMGQTTCALYLSLRYHQLNPNYIHNRLKQLGRSYELRVLLVQIDIKEPHHLLKELAKICILADCTLILAFSTEEAGRYLETYKVYENKPPDAIMEKTDQNFMAKMTDCLTNIKSVNKTDVATLISTFGSLKNVAEASQEDLSFCPGFGPQKAKRVHDLFKEPFLKANKYKQKK